MLDSSDDEEDLENPEKEAARSSPPRSPREYKEEDDDDDDLHFVSEVIVIDWDVKFYTLYIHSFSQSFTFFIFANHSKKIHDFTFYCIDFFVFWERFVLEWGNVAQVVELSYWRVQDNIVS